MPTVCHIWGLGSSTPAFGNSTIVYVAKSIQFTIQLLHHVSKNVLHLVLVGIPSSSSMMSFITGVLRWDIFVVYIIFCVIFVGCCCISILLMFYCCPAKESGPALFASTASMATRESSRFHITIFTSCTSQFPV